MNNYYTIKVFWIIIIIIDLLDKKILDKGENYGKYNVIIRGFSSMSRSGL